MPDIVITIVSGETVDLGLSVPGVQGPVGQGVASGGASGTVLVKQSATDFDAAWTSTLSGIVLIAPTLSGTIVNNGTISGGTISGIVSTGSGLVLASASGLLGFYGATATLQPSGIVIPSGGASTDEVGVTVSGIIVALQNLGLLGA
jgi:hypothetical protein